MKIGLVQTRGMGDIIIALPIAKYFCERGNEVFWPIDESFMSSFKDAAPWVNWLSVNKTSLEPMLITPLEILKSSNVDKIIVLYSYLSSDIYQPNKLLQTSLKFDQYKYAISGVPFSKKWNLKDCIYRNSEREEILYNSLVKQEKYMVIHQQGSNFHRIFGTEEFEKIGYQIIEIKNITDNIFDWLKIIEGASALALIDSAFSNLVEQLGIADNIPKFYGLRSNVNYTPVQMSSWHYI
jgi:hypothetical protein